MREFMIVAFSDGPKRKKSVAGKSIALTQRRITSK
jgi:hypothetical protein